MFLLGIRCVDAGRLRWIDLHLGVFRWRALQSSALEGVNVDFFWMLKHWASLWNCIEKKPIETLDSVLFFNFKGSNTFYWHFSSMPFEIKQWPFSLLPFPPTPPKWQYHARSWRHVGCSSQTIGLRFDKSPTDHLGGFPMGKSEGPNPLRSDQPVV